MTERKEPFEAGRDAIRNLAEKFAEPTEAEIAAANNIWEWNNRHQPKLWSGIIARHNAPLHAKLEKQKAALELAQKAMVKNWDYDDDGFCRCCSFLKRREHSSDCELTIALAAIKEALQ